MARRDKKDAEILIRVTSKLKAELVVEAERHSRSLSDYCRLALMAHLDRLTEVAMTCRWCKGKPSVVRVKDREVCTKCGKEQ